MTDKDNKKPRRKVVPQPLASGAEPPPLTDADLARHERRRQGWRSNHAYRSPRTPRGR